MCKSPPKGVTFFHLRIVLFQETFNLVCYFDHVFQLAFPDYKRLPTHFGEIFYVGAVTNLVFFDFI